MKSEYLDGVEPLPADLLKAAAGRNMTERDRRRLRRAIDDRKQSIRIAREAHNLGLPAESCVYPEPPEPPEQR